MSNNKIKKDLHRQIENAATKVTQSRRAACLFLKSAGIMTSKGNLSPKYKS